VNNMSRLSSDHSARPTANERSSTVDARPGAKGAVQQRDAADEGRLDAYGNVFVGTIIMNQGRVVRPSQLIASVGRTRTGWMEVGPADMLPYGARGTRRWVP
jgi:hypothetical protein